MVRRVLAVLVIAVVAFIVLLTALAPVAHAAPSGPVSVADLVTSGFGGTTSARSSQPLQFRCA